MSERQRTEEVVRAKRFELVDENGEVRAVLGFTKGASALWLCDENGNARVALKVAPDGSPVLTFANQAGKQCLGFAVMPDGTPMMVMFDAADKMHLLPLQPAPSRHGGQSA